MFLFSFLQFAIIFIHKCLHHRGIAFPTPLFVGYVYTVYVSVVFLILPSTVCLFITLLVLFVQKRMAIYLVENMSRMVPSSVIFDYSRPTSIAQKLGSYYKQATGKKKISVVTLYMK